MPQVINTNIASINAQRNLNSSQRANDTALQRLSSGLRINSARDDAAGLAISTRFDAQVRGTSVAIRNSGDGISLAQTAEGALNNITTSLQRVRELALQSANDTNTDLDRQALNAEAQQLIEEIGTISEKASFNGRKLLDGSFSTATFQTGANVGESISFGIAGATLDTLGTAQTNGISSSPGGTVDLAAGSLAMAAGDLVLNGISVGASTGSTDGASNDLKSSSAISKAAAINAVSDLSGVVATVNANVAGGTTVAAAADTAYSFDLNGVTITFDTAANNSQEQNVAVTVDAINAVSGQTGVVAVYTGDVNTGIDLVAADGRNITLDETTGSTTDLGLAASDADGQVFVGSLTLVSEDGSDIVISTDTGDIDNVGLEVGTFSGANSGVVGDGSDLTTRTADLATGDIVINGIAVGPASSTSDTASTAGNARSAISIADAINKVADSSGVTAEALSNVITSDAVVAADDDVSIAINGVTVSAAFDATDEISLKIGAFVDAVNASSGQTGVTAQALGADQFQLIAEDGRNITLGAGTYTAGDMGLTNLESETHMGGVSLISAGEIVLSSTTGSISSSGFAVGTYGGSGDGQLLRDLDISTVDGALTAITAVDNALQTVAGQAADLGAIQNRFSATIVNLESTGENLAAANSRIKDADFAAETAALARSQVLQQAGISILAQANARSQQVLSLLQ